MKRIKSGPVRGISIKLQEEERERRDQFVPDISAIEAKPEGIQVDAETKEMLAALVFSSISFICSFFVRVFFYIKVPVLLSIINNNIDNVIHKYLHHS